MPQSPLAQIYEPWPALPYEEFSPTAYLLHRALQILGKLKLKTPFEAHWANVVLWVTSSGLSTGPIPYGSGTYSVDMDIMGHQIICVTSWGHKAGFKLMPCSTAKFTKILLDTLHGIGIDVSINLIPQEMKEEPIPFDKDNKPCPYDEKLVTAWWRILVSSQRVFQVFHSRFLGVTPPVGYMWGTSDLRDARYLNKPVTEKPNSYIGRNAFDAYQIEAGWWPGDSSYPHAAYFSLTFPRPAGIEQEKVQPDKAFWNNDTGIFVVNYDDIRNSADPEAALLAFLESTYQAGAKLQGWDPDLVGSGKPV